jgi:hypothetical protein
MATCGTENIPAYTYIRNTLITSYYNSKLWKILSLNFTKNEQL